MHVGSADDGRVRLQFEGVESFIESAGFDLVRTANGVRLVATGTSTTFQIGPAGEGRRITAVSFEAELSGSRWTMTGVELTE